MPSVASQRFRALEPNTHQRRDAMPLSNTLTSPSGLYSHFLASNFDGNATTDFAYSSPSYADFSVNHAPGFSEMEPLSREELERFQKLSNEYEPDLQGPLVSAKQSSQTIASEYSNADPTYVAKTNALAVTHPFTRVMKGDGNCGWRAVAFGYFENLLNLRDVVKAQQELARIKSMNRLLDQVGHQEYLYETFVDATEEAFNQVIDSINKGVPDEEFLVNIFNDFNESMSIITHFRLLTSSWMKLNPVRYQAFLSTPLDQYCSTRIEPTKTEIDEVGLQALVDSVIEGSEFAVEILYLDRSQGDAVTPHLLSPNRHSVATIKLLYRPGHYDLLYSAEPTIHMSPVVNYQYGMTMNYTPWDSGALSFDMNPHLMSIPGLMMDPSPYTPVSSSVMPPTSPGFMPSPPQHEFYSPSLSPSVSTTVSSPASSNLPLSPVQNKPLDGPQIRLNPLVMKPNLSHSLPVTTPFKNHEQAAWSSTLNHEVGMVELDVPVRLRRAILQNDVLLVKRIVKNNRRSLENPDFADKSNTSLHLAASRGHVDIVNLLISFGHDSCTPIIDPTGYNWAPGIALNTDGSTALHLAAAHSHAACVEALCQHFPHIINWRNHEGQTALMLAAQSSSNNPGVVATNPSATNTRPRAVSTEEDTATIAALLDCGAAVGITDAQGNTALHHASAWGNLKAVRILLAAGASPFVRNRANHTPIEYSVTKQAAQYFQAIIAELGKHRDSGSSGSLQLNTAVAAAAAAAAADEPRSAASVHSAKATKSPFPKGMSPNKANSNINNVGGGLRLVIDTENNELADIEDDDDDVPPYTAKKVSIEEQRVKP
ncbi:ubiquitin thioesterase protein OTUB1 [Talaromyces islandicus]|uniref:ubiquitinyl hydrolase 1 n=1 Tax=Talaromyces islandicus TaxID=28573 RepID=A0A0U1LLB5_TALIS|nr:ubiquitin thioesterase protein OTUB1 [Talaromyces islandicus]